MEILSNRENKQIFLMKCLEEVAQEENFPLIDLEEKYKPYFVSFESSDGDRCVDDRYILTGLSEQYPYDKTQNSGYKGIALPGGTFGFIDALRYVTEMREDEAQNLVMQVYQENKWLIGDHIDDEHGQISDPEILKQRNQGCGDQDKKRAGLIPMLKDIVTSDDVDSRFIWIRNKGFLPVLAGEHRAKIAIVNLKEGETYCNEKAVKDDNYAFNFDLAEVEKRAAVFGQALEDQDKLSGEKNQFIEEIVRAVLRNYFQTLKALNGPAEIQVRK